MHRKAQASNRPSQGRQMRMRDWNVDFNAQFGALDIIADALIEATRREAE